MIQHIVLYPIIVQLLLAILLLFSWNSVKIQKYISAGGSIISLLVAIGLMITVWNEGTLTIQAGGWKAPLELLLLQMLLLQQWYYSLLLVVLLCPFYSGNHFKSTT